MSENIENDFSSDIAIIGVSGRFPKAKNVEQLWKNLLNSVECVRFFTDEEILASGVSEEDLRDPGYVKSNIILEDVEYFDAKFFEVTPREAEVMDPQFRFALECAWEALEDAGCSPEKTTDPIGVFGGCYSSSYFLNNVYPQVQKGKFTNKLQADVAHDPDLFATHIAYKLNLTGPCMSIGTACSSSLVAIHVASQSLLNGECGVALVGGAFINPPLTLGYKSNIGSYESSDGRCKPFDADAKGAVAGSGAAFVVLKCLEDAIADKDQIYAVIKGSAVNNDGSAKIGFTAPSIEGQTNVVAEAISMSGVDIESIRYIETHGTGTILGDPIEVAALTRAFRKYTDKNQFCTIGSIKSNIGHMVHAAGVTGLIKASLAVKTKTIPATINFTKPNPNIDFKNSPFYVNNTLMKVEDNNLPFRAGISSLGIGGTNAHVIIEEPPKIHSKEETRDFQILTLSAKTEEALKEMSENLKDFLLQKEDLKIADAAFTLQKGRKDFDFRKFFLVPSDKSEAVKAINPNLGFSSKVLAQENNLVFLFSGGGTQYINMGKDLFESETLFREKILECAEIIKTAVNFDLIDIIYSSNNQTEKSEILKQPRYALPALFSIEYALAELWMSWGIKPNALIGHSLGEYTAAHLAGVIELEDVLKLVCLRGELFHKLDKGAMLTASLSEQELKVYVSDDLDIAAINGPSRLVVSGAVEAINKLEQKLKADNIDCRILKIDTAGHSKMVESIIPELVGFFKNVTLKAPSIPYISNVSGTWITNEEATSPQYWAQHLRQTVRFSDGIREIFKKPNTIMMEVGPGNALSSFARLQMDIQKDHSVLNSMRHPNQEKNDLEFLLETLGKLWLKGINVDWDTFFSNENRKKISLPTYPFQRKRYWIEAEKDYKGIPSNTENNKIALQDWFYIPTWQKMPQIKSFENEADSSNERNKEILVFCDSYNLGEELSPYLEKSGYNIKKVLAGSKFKKESNSIYTIDVHNQSDYTKLFESLKKDQLLPSKIIHLLNITGEGEDYQSDKYFAHSSYLLLAKAIHQNNLTNPIEIYAIINKLEDVTGNDAVDINKSLITGPSKVIPYEFFNISFKIIDINKEVVSKEAFYSNLSKEIIIPSEYYTVALRGKNRWVKDFLKVELPKAQKEKLNIKSDGVYVVTGGLGGMGLTIAEYLSEYKATLILLTRSNFPSEDLWEELAESKDSKEELSRILNKLVLFKSNKARVEVHSCELSNQEHVKKLFSDIKKKFGKISGIFHCAGVNDSAAIPETSNELTLKVFGPKVAGTKNVYSSIQNEKIDFFINCSSLSSVTSAINAVDYVSANAFLDAFSNKYNSENMFVSSINWDIWEDVGMIKRNNLEDSIKKAGEDAYIYPDQGLEVFLRVLQSGLPQVLVSTRDFSIIKEKNKIINDLSIKETEEEEVKEIETAYDRPNLSSAYVEAQSETEKILADIWQQVLRVSKIGIHDNFFELGGESLMGIQIIAKARKAGLIIQPKQMYTLPTIHELAKVVQRNAPENMQQGIIKGESQLTPIEHAFFELELKNINHWNIPLLFEVPNDFKHELLEELLVKLIEHHDSFRLRYNKKENGEWTKKIREVDKKELYETLDLSNLEEIEYNKVLLRKCNEFQKTLDIGKGPIVRIIYIKGPTPNLNRVLFMMHHLVADGFSLQFIIEDFISIYKSLKEGKEVVLPQKTSSLNKYAEELHKLSDTENIKNDFSYWENKLSKDFKKLSYDYPDGENLVKQEDSIQFELSQELTKDLMHLFPLKLNVTIQELLLASFAKAFATKLNSMNVLFSIVGHGRELLTERVDISRTAGWFGDGHPIVFSLKQTNILAVLDNVKKQLHNVPNYGLSYGILKYLSKDKSIRDKLHSLPFPSININYLGQFENMIPEDFELKTANELVKDITDENDKRRFLHDITIYISNATLKIEWNYAGGLFKKETIHELLQLIVTDIKSVVQKCKDSKERIYLSSDFPYANLSEKQLNNLTQRYKNIKNFYPVTPLQSVMISRGQKKKRHRAYLTQSVINMSGEENVVAFCRSWNAIVEKYDVFRTAFVYEDSKLLQVVNNSAELPLINLDWSKENELVINQKFQKLLQEDRVKGFNIEKAPLLRLHVIELSNSNYKILLTAHHAIMDGWSSGIVTNDINKYIKTLKKSEKIHIIKPQSEFVKYIGYLESQDTNKTKQYWQEEMNGFQYLNYFKSLKNTAVNESTPGYGVLMQSFSFEFSTKLNEYAKNTQLTLNTLFQGAWALLLASLSDEKDLTFGVTVSGRSSELDSFSDIVGQCSNSLPLRVSLDEKNIIYWLKTIQEKNILMRENENISIDDIKKFCNLSPETPLYESNIIFENIPMTDLQESDHGIINSDWIDAWHFPIRLFVFPQKEITIRLAFDNCLFQKDQIQRILTKLENILEIIISKEFKNINHVLDNLNKTKALV